MPQNLPRSLFLYIFVNSASALRRFRQDESEAGHGEQLDRRWREKREEERTPARVSGWKTSRHI